MNLISNKVVYEKHKNCKKIVDLKSCSAGMTYLYGIFISSVSMTLTSKIFF